jgi:hypothetical protein
MRFKNLWNMKTQYRIQLLEQTKSYKYQPSICLTSDNDNDIEAVSARLRLARKVEKQETSSVLPRDSNKYLIKYMPSARKVRSYLVSDHHRNTKNINDPLICLVSLAKAVCDFATPLLGKSPRPSLYTSPVALQHFQFSK